MEKDVSIAVAGGVGRDKTIASEQAIAQWRNFMSSPPGTVPGFGLRRNGTAVFGSILPQRHCVALRGYGAMTAGVTSSAPASTLRIRSQCEPSQYTRRQP